MANTDSNKSSSEGDAPKTGGSTSKSGSKSASRSTRSNNRSSSPSSRRSTGGQSKRSNGSGRGRSVTEQLPGWSTTVASLVGVGVALGFGLFASRRHWMPYAGEANRYLHDRWNDMGYSADHSDYDDDDDDDDLYAEDDLQSSAVGGYTPKTASGDNSDTARVGL